MQARRPKWSSLWLGATLPMLFFGLVVGAVLAPPAALAGGRHQTHSDGAVLSSTQSSGKPRVSPSGPHPHDTINKSSMKNRVRGQ
ncbi:conserved protein of unknown function [Burkholderia multivorans]